MSDFRPLWGGTPLTEKIRQVVFEGLPNTCHFLRKKFLIVYLDYFFANCHFGQYLANLKIFRTKLFVGQICKMIISLNCT